MDGPLQEVGRLGDDGEREGFRDPVQVVEDDDGAVDVFDGDLELGPGGCALVEADLVPLPKVRAEDFGEPVAVGERFPGLGRPDQRDVGSLSVEAERPGGFRLRGRVLGVAVVVRILEPVVADALVLVAALGFGVLLLGAGDDADVEGEDEPSRELPLRPFGGQDPSPDAGIGREPELGGEDLAGDVRPRFVRLVTWRSGPGVRSRPGVGVGVRLQLVGAAAQPVELYLGIPALAELGGQEGTRVGSAGENLLAGSSGGLSREVRLLTGSWGEGGSSWSASGSTRRTAEVELRFRRSIGSAQLRQGGTGSPHGWDHGRRGDAEAGCNPEVAGW